MKHIRHILLVPLSLFILAVPSVSHAQFNGRAFTPRELQPFGQMRDEIYEKTATFRLIRTQEERRPRDARALGPQDLGEPGIARPELINSIRRNRKKAYSGGWQWDGGGETADQNEGWTPMLEDPTDYNLDRQGSELSATEWWEQKFRGQGQRGGWFRARFGSGSSSSGGIQAGGGGGTASQSQQQPVQQGGGMQGGGMGGMQGGGM